MVTDKNQSSQNEADLSDEAIDWLVRLHSGTETEEDHEAFALWRAQSEAHERAAAEAETIWYCIGPADERRRVSQRSKTRRAVLGGGLVAIGAIAAMRTGLIYPGLFFDHVTETGERRAVTLADGSILRMNAETAVSVNLGDTERQVILHRGQAIFEVAHDARRPFIVEASGGRTQAIGTAFDVCIRSDGVAVTVLEGVVKVFASNRPSEFAIASANQRVRYAAGDLAGMPESVNADAVTAWRRGKLIFDRRPLVEVVSEVDRQLDGRIVIVNPELAGLRVTGVFDLENPRAVMDAIASSLPVQVIRLPRITILR